MKDLPITQINLPPGVIDLGMGNPDLDLLPTAALQQASEAYFSAADARPLQYGAEQGDAYFRQALADFLSGICHIPSHPDTVFITSGASAALDLICTLYTRPGDVIFVEEPTYFLALRIFADHGLRVISIPMDDEGLRLDTLEEKLVAFHPKLIYTIPAFQNPSGRTLSQDRREKLAELAQRHDFLIAADEVYQLLAYHQTPPRPFAAMVDDVEQVISINSFSKILAPGLRLGWIQTHPKVLARLTGCGLLDSGGGMNPFTSALVRGLIEAGGLGANIAKLRIEYAQRLGVMNAALRQHIPMAEFSPPEGGFFFWVRLPGVNTVTLRAKAKSFDVDLRPGRLFSSAGEMQNYARLSFCCYGSEEIEAGIKRLSYCLE